jgi:hypothetical protein
VATLSARLKNGDVLRVEFAGDETHLPSSDQATYSNKNGAG